MSEKKLEEKQEGYEYLLFTDGSPVIFFYHQGKKSYVDQKGEIRVFIEPTKEEMNEL